MGLNKNVKQQTYSRYYNLLKSSSVNAASAITIGFEWEIPLSVQAFGFDEIPEELHDECGDDWYHWHEEIDYLARRDSFVRTNTYAPSDETVPFSRTWLQKLGYLSHFECGGLEIDSPIFNNLAMARSHARHMIQLARKQNLFNMDGNSDPWNDCGIHVHVGSNSGGVRHIGRIVDLMWNRSENELLLPRLTGRDDSKTYQDQGYASCWDSGTYGYRHSEYGSDSVSINEPDGVDTMEMRMFSSGSELLIPALECAHSSFKFARTVAPSIEEWRWEEWDYMNKKVPHFKHYKKWLDQQPGYTAIKERLALVA